jgi:thiamine pyrophosphokinase
MKRAVIICGGPGRLSEKTEFKDALIICADGGYEKALEAGLVPDYAMGDFDTYRGSIAKDTEVVRVRPEKDYTDTELCCRKAVEKGAEEVILAGALGGRADHAIANIQLVFDLVRKGIAARIEDEDNIISFQFPSEKSYPRLEGMYFSLYAYTESCRGLKVRGTKYEAFGIELKNGSSLGTSNEIISEQASVSFEEGCLLAVYSRDRS